MAFPTAVNDQITDSVTQANVLVAGSAGTVALGNLYQATAHAMANAAHNAVAVQQQNAIVGQAAMTLGIATLYSLAPALDAVDISALKPGAGLA